MSWSLLGYRVVRALIVLVCRLAFRVRVSGLEHVPAHGAFVVAPVHRSLLDIPFAGFITRQRIRYMGKRELWKHRALGSFFTAMGAFPVDRDGTDTAAVRTALSFLKAGEPVVVFPEGTRNQGPVVGPLQEGAAYLAVKVGVPVVPVGIGGSEEILPSGTSFPRLRPVAVVVGAPIRAAVATGPVKRATTAALTDELHAALQQAFDEARLRA